MIANAPYYEEGFFYSPTFDELSDFLWGFTNKDNELSVILNRQNVVTSDELKKIGINFIELEGQIQIYFLDKAQLKLVIKEVWAFEKEEGEAVFVISRKNENFLSETEKIALIDIIQKSQLTFIRGHDCAYMQIYSNGINFESILTLLKHSVRGQNFEIKYVENYLDTDWVRSWERSSSFETDKKKLNNVQ